MYPPSLNSSRAPDSAIPAITDPASFEERCSSESSRSSRFASHARASDAERIGLCLAPELDPAGDGGVAASLPEEDQPVDVGRGRHRAQKPGHPFDQGRSGVAQIGVFERAPDLGEDPLLLPREEPSEELVLGGKAGVDDRLAHPGLAGDRFHRGTLVAMLEEEAEGGVQNLWAAALRSEVSGALAWNRSLPGSRRHFLPMVANSYYE